MLTALYFIINPNCTLVAKCVSRAEKFESFWYLDCGLTPPPPPPLSPKEGEATNTTEYLCCLRKDRKIGGGGGGGEEARRNTQYSYIVQCQKISILPPPPPPTEGFLFCTLPSPRKFQFTSYFASKILTFKTPLPLEISNDILWGGYGFRLELTY